MSEIRITQPERLEHLLLIVAFAYFLAMLLGGLARYLQYDRHFK